VSLGVLFPAALALGVLVLGPVLAHLARQEPGARQPFGAMLLLDRLLKRIQRRRRLRDLLLLLARMLFVGLVVLAAARPELEQPGGVPEFGGTGSVVIVLDNSMSMNLVAKDGTLFSLARDAAVKLVRALPPQALVGAIVDGGEAERLTPSLMADHERVASLLEQVEARQGGTDLAGALRAASKLLGGGPGEVIIFTDEAGPLAVPQAKEAMAQLLGQGASLIPRRFAVETPSNVAPLQATYGDGPEGGTVALEVANYGPVDLEVPCTVRLPGGTEIDAFVEVPAGGIGKEQVTVPRVAAGGVALVEVKDEALEADNVFAFHLPSVGASRVLVVDGDPGPTPVASEVYFLERALAPWGLHTASRSGVLPDVTAASGIPTLDPDVHRVVFLANVADPAPLAADLVAFVRKGGGLVVSMGNNVTAERYNDALQALLPAPLRKPRGLAAPGEPGEPTALPDVTRPLFEPFARGGRGGFSRIRWNQIFTLEPYADGGDVSTLLSLESGLPLLVERQVERGKVLLLLGTVDLAWGDLPLQAVFMPLVQRIVRYLGGESSGSGDRLDASVGSTVTVPIPDPSLDVFVTGPHGAVASRVDGTTVVFRPDRAGAYVVETPGAPPLAYVAVNVPSEESDVRAGPEIIATAATVDPKPFTIRHPLAPWLLWGALGLAVGQAALSRGKGT
jgi:hypothetical protein